MHRCCSCTEFHTHSSETRRADVMVSTRLASSTNKCTCLAALTRPQTSFCFHGLQSRYSNNSFAGGGSVGCFAQRSGKSTTEGRQRGHSRYCEIRFLPNVLVSLCPELAWRQRGRRYVSTPSNAGTRVQEDMAKGKTRHHLSSALRNPRALRVALPYVTA